MTCILCVYVYFLLFDDSMSSPTAVFLFEALLSNNRYIHYTLVYPSFMFYISFHSFQTCTYFSWIFNVPYNKKKTTTPEAACKTPILGILYIRQNMKENLSRNEKRKTCGRFRWQQQWRCTENKCRRELRRMNGGAQWISTILFDLYRARHLHTHSLTSD